MRPQGKVELIVRANEAEARVEAAEKQLAEVQERITELERLVPEWW